MSVFNGDDHYCVTEPKKVTSKESTEIVIEHLNEALDVALSLKAATNDSDIIGIFSKLIDITKSQTRALSKIFNYGETEETSIEVPTLSRPPQEQNLELCPNSTAPVGY